MCHLIDQFSCVASVQSDSRAPTGWYLPYLAATPDKIKTPAWCGHDLKPPEGAPKTNCPMEADASPLTIVSVDR